VTERGPVEANRTLELLGTVLRAAMNDGLIASNPASRSWRSARGNKERSRTRYLKKDEFRAFAQAVREESDPYFRALVWLLLLTGARSKSELLRLRWDDIDWTNGLITLRRSKVDDELTLPLSEPAKKILADLPRAMGNPFVFPGRSPGTHRKTMKHQFNRMRAKAGFTGENTLTVHDLRRTAGSLLAQAGVPLYHIKNVLGHRNEAMTQIYARLGEDETKAAVDVLGSLVSEIQGEPVESTVGDDLDAEEAALRARLEEIEGARRAASATTET
jgi:integrase